MQNFKCMNLVCTAHIIEHTGECLKLIQLSEVLLIFKQKTSHENLFHTHRKMISLGKFHMKLE